MVLLLDAAKKRLISVETIYLWASQEKIPSVHIGRRLLFDQEDLDRMIEACKRAAR